MRVLATRSALVLAAICAWVASGPVGALEPDYLLGPEDCIEVVVLRHEELSVSGVIPPDGKIVVPIVGEILAAGKTRTQLAKEIAERLRGRIPEPEVAVVINEMRMRRVYVVGAVSGPGIIDAKPGWRVTELLAAVGGLAASGEGTPIAPQHAAARLLRQDGKVLEVDLVKILASPKGPDNVVIEPGDVLTVLPSVLTGAYIIGRVAAPGFYQLTPGAGVAQAIRRAGGPQAGVELTKVQIYHADGTHETADMHRAYVEEDPSLDKPVRGGDAILVP